MSDHDQYYDVDAGEFIPSEGVQSEQLIAKIVSRVFDRSSEVSQSAEDKVMKILGLKWPSTPEIVGGALVDNTLLHSGNASTAFNTLKRIKASFSAEISGQVDWGVFKRLHEQCLRLISSDFLPEMAGLKENSSPGSGDSPATDNRFALMAELLHLLTLCSNDLYNNEEGQMSSPPLPVCIDMLLLASAVLSVQSELAAKQRAEGHQGAVKKPNNEWNCLLDAFLSRLNASLPRFNDLIMFAEAGTFGSTCCAWMTHRVSAKPPSPVKMEEDGMINIDNLTPLNLINLVNTVLSQVKHLLVADCGLPSLWLRTTALDLLMTSSAMSNAPFSGYNNRSAWRAQESDEEDDFVIEGVADTDKTEIMRDFQDFLSSTGQF